MSNGLPVQDLIDVLVAFCEDDNNAREGSHGLDHPFMELNWNTTHFPNQDNYLGTWSAIVFLPPHGGANRTDELIRAESETRPMALHSVLIEVINGCYAWAERERPEASSGTHNG